MRSDVPSAVRRQNKVSGLPQNRLNSGFLSTFRVIIGSIITIPPNQPKLLKNEFYPPKAPLNNFKVIFMKIGLLWLVLIFGHFWPVCAEVPLRMPIWLEAR